MHIEKRGNSLLVRFTHDGKPYSFSLPKHNNPVGISNANQKIAQIQKDIAYGNFDNTLLRYKPRTLGKNPTAITAARLFELYADYRAQDRELSRSSLDRLKGIASKLKQLLGDKPAEKVTESVAKDAISRWSEAVSDGTIKERLFDLKACWEWAKGKYHTTEINPWSECLDRARSRGKGGQSRQQNKPFTIAELQAIVTAFKAHPHYYHYTEFVIFLSHTACRFGEAAGLRWKHLGADFSTAWIGESISRGHQNHKGTKTGKTRTIQLSPTVISMLGDRRNRLKPNPEDLVFPSPKGLPINDHRFRARAWKTILESCQIEYRSPYKIRHSAISHALNNGANFIALAEQTGHDKRVLLSTYAHAIEQECLFVDIG
ncbi:tyrosine-type recombinase/integrase [Chamaesiphon sp. OTE_8_metabat_110]|uniref:tyrosine-type recombinase/integrase n=1 Tax=Chamaesiphon sp. OTE_8_metabat_110 TaxID=2964696 RepID=UPI002869FEE5|nr:tyrosine-type recombinase/integrase [Chamaesiphon sp. OTE_8_metabat_110]